MLPFNRFQGFCCTETLLHYHTGTKAKGNGSVSLCFMATDKKSKGTKYLPAAFGQICNSLVKKKQTQNSMKSSPGRDKVTVATAALEDRKSKQAEFFEGFF